MLSRRLIVLQSSVLLLNFFCFHIKLQLNSLIGSLEKVSIQNEHLSADAFINSCGFLGAYTAPLSRPSGPSIDGVSYLGSLSDIIIYYL